MGVRRSESGALVFGEKMRWSLSLWLFLIFLLGSLDLALWAAFGNNLMPLTISISILILILTWIGTSLEISVTQAEFTCGNFKISRNYIKQVTPLDKNEMRQIRGVSGDPAAHLELRFWVNTGIKIEISDPNDPTPYILISSKKYKKLSAILTN